MELDFYKKAVNVKELKRRSDDGSIHVAEMEIDDAILKKSH